MTDTNYRLLPVALHPAIEEALKRYTWMPESAWQDVIAAADRVKPACEPIRMSTEGLTDMAKRLRGIAEDPMSASHCEVSKATLLAAADECDRFYGGMIIWKECAQNKDRIIAENYTHNSKIAAPERSGKTADEAGLRDAVQEGLRGLKGCGRVWSAWGVGTMSEQDFYSADQSDECIDQVMDAIRPFFEPAPAASSSAAPSDDLPPVWRDGAPNHPWDKEWFIAITTHGERVVLKALDKEFHSYDYTTADKTYIKRDKIKCWMQFHDSEYIAPDATPSVQAVAAGQEWQPIEAAPKDREVWAFNGEQARMVWSEGDCWALWLWADELLQDADPSPDQPTHWKPLPKPPALAGDTQAKGGE